MIKQEYILSDITAEVSGAAFEVHKTIGTGFVESVYQKAMIVECGISGIETASEIELPVFYRSVKVDSRRADLLIKKKAVTELNDTHLAPAINYREAFNPEAGRLIKFGSKSMPYKRVIHPKRLTPKNQ